MLLRSCWLIDCVVFNVLFDSIIIHMEIPALMMKGCCGNGTSSCHKCSDAESRVMVSSEEPTTGVFCTTRASHDPCRSDVCCDGFYMSIRYYVDMSRYICCTSTCSYSCFSHIEQGINIITHEILFIWRINIVTHETFSFEEELLPPLSSIRRNTNLQHHWLGQSILILWS